MANSTELLRVPTFADLPDDQIAWFLSQSQEVSLKAGDVYARQGDPPEAMFVLLEGEFQWRGEFGGETIVIAGKVGDVTGALPFSRMKQFTVTGRAVTDGRILRFPSSLFPELIQKMPELAKRLVGVMADRIRETTRGEQQRDRLAGLGKLSAGLAHELNNPASAVRRTAQQLRTTVGEFRKSVSQLEGIQLTDAERSAIETFESSCCDATPETDVLKASKVEAEIDAILHRHGIRDGWQYTSSLVESGVQAEPLNLMLDGVRREIAEPALKRVSAVVEINDLLAELENSTSKISDLVR